MSDFFKSAPEIITAAAASTWGIFALMIIALAVLAFFFFRRSPVKVRVGIFAALFIGVAGFCITINLEAHKKTSDPSGIPLGVQFVASRNSDIYHYPTCRYVGSIKPENRLFDDAAKRGRILHARCPDR